MSATKSTFSPSSSSSTPTKNKIKVAVVQASPVILDKEGTINKVEAICKENGCHGKGAELILFPEAFISWYPRGNSFGIVIGSRTPEGKEIFRKYWESSVTVPGPEVDRLSHIARENKLHLVVGVIEREDISGTLYCTIVYFDDAGKFLGKHRKVMPTAGERLVWGFGDGSTIPVFQTSIGRIGGVICWENYMPMIRMSLYGKGVQIYLAPTADARDAWLNTMRHIATEGRCFVLSCNQFVKRSDYKEGVNYAQEFPSDDPNYVICRGGSCIVDPNGELLAGPNYEGETVLHAELDLHEIIRSKIDFDPIGHYSRPDIFSLTVNETHCPPVKYVINSPQQSKDNKKKEEQQVAEQLQKVQLNHS